MSEPRSAPERGPPAGGRPLRLSDNALVRGVGRLPAKVHTKLLVAFVGTAVLVVAVGLLGLRVLGQAHDRAERLGALEERALAYGKLESDARNIRLLLVENPGPDTYEVNPGTVRPGRGPSEVAIDLAVGNALLRIGLATRVDSLGFVPPAADRFVLEDIRRTSERLSAVMQGIIEAEIGGASPRIRVSLATRPPSSPSTSIRPPRT